jgi:hypothetical protein
MFKILVTDALPLDDFGYAVKILKDSASTLSDFDVVHLSDLKKSVQSLHHKNS